MEKRQKVSDKAGLSVLRDVSRNRSCGWLLGRPVLLRLVLVDVNVKGWRSHHTYLDIEHKAAIL